MAPGYLLIDGNSIGFAAQNGARLTVAGREIQAVFGTVRTIRTVIETYPHMKTLVLWDGKSWRKERWDFYKANRNVDPKIAKMRESYKSQRPIIAKVLKTLGVAQLSASNLEADDLFAIFVRKAKAQNIPVILATGDKDLLQLVQPRVVWMDFIRERSCNVGNFEEFTGYSTPRAFVEAKALTGDISDNVPGVGGIGEKGAKELLARWGDVATFLATVETVMDAGEFKKLPKKFRDFATNEKGGIDIFHRNLEIMDLNHPNVPKPERMNLVKGALSTDSVIELFEELAFNSILKDFDEWISPFVRHAA